MKTTLWSPDTCQCRVAYSWDETVPQDERVHTPVPHFVNPRSREVETRACEHHQHLYGSPEHHDTVLEENQRKNRAHGAALELLADTHGRTVDDADGAPVVEWKPGVFSWGFDADRVLIVSVAEATPPQKIRLQSTLTELLGAGKTKVA